MRPRASTNRSLVRLVPIPDTDRSRPRPRPRPCLHAGRAVERDASGGCASRLSSHASSSRCIDLSSSRWRAYISERRSGSPSPSPSPSPPSPGTAAFASADVPAGDRSYPAQGTRGRPREPRSDALRVETAVATGEDLERVHGIERGVAHGAVVGDVHGGAPPAPVPARVVFVRDDVGAARGQPSPWPVWREARCLPSKGSAGATSRRADARTRLERPRTASARSRARLRVRWRSRVVPPRSAADGVHAVGEASQASSLSSSDRVDGGGAPSTPRDPRR